MEYDQRLGYRHYLSSGKKKRELITRREIQSLWGCQHLDWLYLGSIGALRGVLVMWDRRLVEKIDKAVGRFSISCKYKTVDQTMIVTGVCFGKS